MWKDPIAFYGMRRLLLLLKRIHLWALFLILEGVCLYIFFHSDTYMFSKYLAFSENITGKTDLVKYEVASYLNLKEKNEELMALNAKLLDENNSLKSLVDTTSFNVAQSPYPSVVALHVIRNEFLNSNNFIVLDGGENKNVRKGMAVIGNEGIVGYVSATSKNFSVVISLLSTDNFVSSAKIKGTSFSGTLQWDGRTHNLVQMAEVPKYAELHVGDTILTTSYSSVFPEDIPIGTVEDFRITDDTFYSVNVRTFTDFSKLDYVYLLELNNKLERDSLEMAAGAQKKK